MESRRNLQRTQDSFRLPAAAVLLCRSVSVPFFFLHAQYDATIELIRKRILYTVKSTMEKSYVIGVMAIQGAVEEHMNSVRAVGHRSKEVCSLAGMDCSKSANVLDRTCSCR
jgi:hypothetical protein